MKVRDLIAVTANWMRRKHPIELVVVASPPSQTPPLTADEIMARLTRLVNDPRTPSGTRTWASEWLRGFDEAREPLVS